jgi:hypothetical protein
MLQSNSPQNIEPKFPSEDTRQQEIIDVLLLLIATT